MGDPLAGLARGDRQHGVGLYMHYSGVWDSEAIRHHPDWAVVNSDGKADRNATSFFGPYAERLLIPQLRELASDYGVDGAWVDGECWAAQPDYGVGRLEGLPGRHRNSRMPRKPGDPHWFEFLQFNRDAFRDYLRHYITEVKADQPRMQLCSNWAFTDHMPEAVCAPVDWISGDFYAGRRRQFRPLVGPVLGAAGKTLGPDGMELHDHGTTQERLPPEIGRAAGARGGDRVVAGGRL